MTSGTKKAIWNAQIAKRAIVDSIIKLNPRRMLKNPVMFVVEVGSVLTTIQLIRGIVAPTARVTNTGFEKLIDRVKADLARLQAENPGQAVPVDLVTTSASGLDPHISPAAAEFQVPRVARERRMTEAEVRNIVAAHTQGRQFSFLGEPRVNVLELNLALDRADASRSVTVGLEEPRK